MCYDRAVGHKRKERRARAVIDVLCRWFSLVPYTGARRLGQADTDGRARSRYDNGLYRDLQLGLYPQPASPSEELELCYDSDRCWLSALFFARKISRVFSVRTELVAGGSDGGGADGEERVYRVYGQVFFASAESFVASFDFKEAVERVRIDLREAHFWDISAVSALDKVVFKFRREGATVELVGLNRASATIIGKHALHDKTDLLDEGVAH